MAISTFLQLKIKHFNKISAILQQHGLNISCVGPEDYKSYIYILDVDIHRPMASRALGELKDWKSILKKHLK